MFITPNENSAVIIEVDHDFIIFKICIICLNVEWVLCEGIVDKDVQEQWVA